MKVFFTSLIIIIGLCSDSFATIYIVNTTSDANSGSGVTGTLRWCIGKTNSKSDKDTITFAITGTGPFTLTVGSNYPTITQPVFINGYSQTGSVQGQLGTGTRSLQIILDGPGNSTVYGFQITSSNCEIAGLVMQDFYKGIYVNGGDNTWIWGNYIGTDVTGLSSTSTEANYDDGIALNSNSNNNIIGTNGNGSNDANEGNLISSYGDAAIQYSGECIAINELGAAGANCTGNWVAGNYLGINESGNAALYTNVTAGGQRGSGVHITNSTANIIGTNADGTSDTYERNIISGCSDEGIVLSGSSSNKIKGNYIGTDKTGLVGIPNYIDGGTNIATGQIVFKTTSTNNFIGTDGDGVNDAIEGNVIGSATITAGSANSYSDGIDIISSSTGNRIAGNKIGIGSDGLTALNILTTGISVNDYAVNLNSSTNTFGTNGDGVSDALESNYVGNSGSGVVIDNATGCIVAGNYLGLCTDLTTAAPLGYTGVYIYNASTARIGSSASNSLERNYICNSSKYGIWIDGNATANNDLINVRYNTIGLRPDAAAAPCAYNGIYLYRQSNADTIQYNTISRNGTAAAAGTYAAIQLGGSAAGEQTTNCVIKNNTIYKNIGMGIAIQNSSSATNKISQNSIYNNGNGSDATGQLKLGIDLNNNGATANDNLDPDTGPNALSNFPVTTGISPSGSTCAASLSVSGTFNGLAATNYVIEVFASDVCNGDTSGVDYNSSAGNNYGEGKTYLGVTGTLTTDASGNVNWTLSGVSLASLTGQYITAIAIQTNGAALNSTSEFSQCYTISPDFGDAPDTYSTLSASCGPEHLNSTATLKIGNTFDIENDGVPSVNADGDGADEDGITTFPTLYTKSTTYTISNIPVTNSTGSAATLYAWIDFNRDGLFKVGEFTSVSVPSSGAQTVNLTWNLAAFTCGTTLVYGQSYLRMRLTTTALSDVGGTPNVDERCQGVAADGEVEDYTLNIVGVDYGDLSASYPVATSVVYENTTSGKVWLGTNQPSVECTPKYSVDAYGDGSEEDGITFSFGPNGVSYTWVIGLNSNEASKTAYYGLWIDWDADGTFNGGSDVFYSGSLVTNGLTTTNIRVFFPIGGSSNAGIRIIVSEAAVTSGMYNAIIVNGEVEDYLIQTILNPRYPVLPVISPTRNETATKVRIYPNPAQSFIHVDHIKPIFKSISILDLTGRQIRQFTITSTKMTVDVSTLLPGSYLIKLSGSGGEETYQFIRTR